MELSREDAYNLMCEWVRSESLRKHMLCVEAVMRAYARTYREDENLWGATGLLHDFDYERFPAYNETNRTGHPFEGVRELERLSYPSQLIQAILGHARYSGVPRTSALAKCLFACDELCGFIVAAALMRPDRLQTLTAESVIKKLKDKKFAAEVSREDIELGVKELGIDRREHINFVIEALRGISEELGF